LKSKTLDDQDKQMLFFDPCMASAYCSSSKKVLNTHFPVLVTFHHIRDVLICWYSDLI